MSQPPTFSSLPTEIRLQIFHLLAASRDSTPINPYFVLDGERYFCDIHNRSECCEPPDHHSFTGCPKPGMTYGLLPGMFSSGVSRLEDNPDLADYIEGVVYRTRHGLLHTCRLGSEVALLEWMEFVKGLEGYGDPPLQPQVLEGLKVLLRMVRGGEGRTTESGMEICGFVALIR